MEKPNSCLHNPLKSPPSSRIFATERYFAGYQKRNVNTNPATNYLIYNLSETDKKEVTLSKEQYGYAEIAGYLSVDGEKVTLRGATLTLPSYSVVVLR